MNIRKQLQEIYLQYVNDFITISAFADYHHIDDQTASLLIAEGRAIHEQEVAALHNS